MKLTSMSFSLIHIIRCTQGILTLLVLALSASVANWYNTTTVFSSPPQINFLVFCAVWSTLSLVCIEVLPRVMPRIPKPYITTPLDLTNTLFYLAGFLALAVFMQHLLFCRDAVCHAARADVAFGAFSFAVWSASAVLGVLEVLKARKGGPGGGGRVGAGVGPVKEGV